MLFALWERYRVFILAIVILLFLSLSFLFYPGSTDIEPSIPFQTPAYASEQTKQPSASEIQVPETLSSNFLEQPESPGKSAKELFVDVKGKIKQPGIYSFSSNERVHHIILRAGGFLPDADRNRVNLALPLSDGMVVWVPSVTDKTSLGSSLPLPCGEVQSKPLSPSPSNTSSGSDKINLNTASLDQLLSLPGIGEAKAKAILTFREKKGGFKSVEQLLEVTGIGDKMFEKIKEKVTL
ncbi:helix-hairpin-helix domain-containing protein [Brevibacillus sp. SYSU BS000544]|uniref:helix-hairpin-helix domain-containing protein n=1 Tax=Brevibacillus sp. SYSU BS000544 TaxID=3416443 RepID=UPI003CE55106